MKKLCFLLLICCFALLLTACEEDCAHRDADDNALCDSCGEAYTDDVDVTPTPPCQHRDADDNTLCDHCGESYTDAVDVPTQAHEHTYDAENTCTDCGHYRDPGLQFALKVRTYEVIGYTGTAETVIIPSVYQGKFVTSIRSYAFSESETVKSISIPESITSIGTAVFAACTALETVTVESDNHVYHSAGNCLIETDRKLLIAGCKTSVIPTDGSVTAIAENAFHSCYDLASLAIPEQVSKIGEGAFYACRTLESIVLPEGITTIELMTFAACTGLVSVTIPESVTKVGNYAFSGCSSLVAITIPARVSSIGTFVFSGCTALQSIEVAKSNPTYHSAGNCLIETASKTLFAGCKTSVIPANGNVSSIGRYAFESCDGLTTVVIPDGVTTIGPGAFFECEDLESVVIPTSITRIDAGAFSNCKRLNTVYFTGNADEWSALAGNIGAENRPLTQGVCYYYSAKLPTGEGLWWYYNINGRPTPWPQ